MSQHGAETTIRPDLQLLLMDCFETLVEMDDAGRYRARLGLGRFLDHFVRKGGARLAVVSDAGPEAIGTALRQANLHTFIDAVFHAGNAATDLGGGRFRKDLSVPLRHYGVGLEHCVFIGDSPADAEAAAHHRVPFIRVPRSEDRSFSFTRLITGASKYNSGEFTQKMLDHYLKDTRRDG